MSGGFQPGELDRLEDALERLDDPGPTHALLDALGLEGELGERFAAYRELNDLLHAQLPMEAPPAGAVARAVEMARAEAASGAESTPLDAGGDDRSGASGWDRFWRGLRSAGLPLATLAGTAALVLWIVRPEGVMSEARIATGEGSTRSLGAVAEPSPGSSTAALPAAELGEEAPSEADPMAGAEDKNATQAGGGSVAQSRAPAESAETKKRAAAPSGDVAAKPAPAAGGYTSADRAARASGMAPADDAAVGGKIGETRASGAQTGPEPGPEGVELDPEAAWAEFDEGADGRDAKEEVQADPKAQRYARLEATHRLRRQGNCGGAVRRYEQLLAEPDLDALQIARAEGGLGLCRELLGDQGVAERHFARARALDPGIGGWLDAERARTPAAAAEAPGPRKSKTARPSADEQP